jgi:hypothetical protein
MSDYQVMGDEKTSIYNKFSVFETEEQKLKRKLMRYLKQLAKLSPLRFQQELLMKTGLVNYKIPDFCLNRGLSSLDEMHNQTTDYEPETSVSYTDEIKSQFWTELCLNCNENFLSRCVNNPLLRPQINWSAICQNKNISDFIISKYVFIGRVSDKLLTKKLRINPCLKIQLLFYKIMSKLF